MSHCCIHGYFGDSNECPDKNHNDNGGDGYVVNEQDCEHPVPTVDMVNQPPHYKAPNDPYGVYEVWEILWAWGLGEAKAKASAIEYILRADRKGNKIEDLKKARQYLDMLIKKLERK